MLTGAVNSSSPPDAIGTWQPVPLKGTGTTRRLFRAFGTSGPPLFDIVDERKRNAGGGVLAARRKTSKRDAESLAFLRSQSFDPCLQRWVSDMFGYSSICAATRSGGNTGSEHSVSNLRV